MLGSLVLALMATGATSEARTRILTQTNPRTIAAVAPSGGRPVTLFHASSGIVAQVSASRRGRTIAFVQHLRRQEPGRPDVTVLTERIWLMRGNGTGAHVVRTFVRKKIGRAGFVTPGDGHGSLSEIYSLDLSDDGRRVLITRGGYMLSMRRDGHLLHELPTPEYRAFDAEYGPGARSIVLHFEQLGNESGGFPDENGIGVTGPDGGGVRVLRSGTFPGDASLSYQPSFSDDGRLVAFTGYTGRGGAIWIIRASGANEHPLAATDRERDTFLEPDFSPNSKSLVFYTPTSRNHSALYTVRRDGTHLRFLAPGPRLTRYRFTPVWTR